MAFARPQVERAQRPCSGCIKLKFWQRTKKSEEELREKEESRVRAPEELRLAEMDSQRSRESYVLPTPQGRSAPF